MTLRVALSGRVPHSAMDVTCHQTNGEKEKRKARLERHSTRPSDLPTTMTTALYIYIYISRPSFFFFTYIYLLLRIINQMDFVHYRVSSFWSPSIHLLFFFFFIRLISYISILIMETYTRKSVINRDVRCRPAGR